MQKSLSLISLTCIIILITWMFPSCKKDTYITTGGKIVFSVDTFMFDTVFTAQGSSTRELLIYNKENASVNLSSIRLQNGSKSSFYFNINGTTGYEVKDVEIGANDSLWVFLGVHIDPTDEDAPFIVEDKLIATLNGNEFVLPIIAFGQNAYYVVDSVLQTQTWKTDKPYVIVHSALVDEDQTLTLPAGVRVYMHADSRLFVMGTLKINGNKTDSVIFQGDRLDRLIYAGDYFAVPGEWGGLYFFKQSYNNEINYAIFKDGGAATKVGEQSTLAATIQVDEDTVRNNVPKLKITNSIIKNSQGYGIVAFKSTVNAENCLIVECGAENVALLQGGDYKFYDCTIATYGYNYLNHSESFVFAASNFLSLGPGKYQSSPLKAEIKNCIIYGSLDNEFLCSAVDDHSAEVNVSHSLIKHNEPFPDFVHHSDLIMNQSPEFKNREEWDYLLSENSPAINKGIQVGSISTDLNGVVRNNPPSIGCYEYQP